MRRWRRAGATVSRASPSLTCPPRQHQGSCGRRHRWRSAGKRRPVFRRAVRTTAWSACRSSERPAIDARRGGCTESASFHELCPLLPDGEPCARIGGAERAVGQMRRIRQRAGSVEKARVLHDAASRRERLSNGERRRWSGRDIRSARSRRRPHGQRHHAGTVGCLPGGRDGRGIAERSSADSDS